MRVASIIFALIGFTLATAIPASTQSVQGRLSMTQVQALVKNQTPDAAVAAEVARRGVDFVPTRETLSSLRTLGAGPKTLDSLDRLRPLLPEAQAMVPGIIDEIIKAFDAGNPSAVRPRLTEQFATNQRSVEALCKPFSHRAHIVESIAENSDRSISAIIRILYQQKPSPTAAGEQALQLTFVAAGDSFLLSSVEGIFSDNGHSRVPVYDAARLRALEIARNIVYATQAGRTEVIRAALTEDMSLATFLQPEMARTFQDFEKVLEGSPNGVERPFIFNEAFALWRDEGGLKIFAQVPTYRSYQQPIRIPPVAQFWFEQIGNDLKIVKWVWTGSVAVPFSDRVDRKSWSAEDPNLIQRTLKRFALVADH